jgi:hypothetical protein
MLSVSCPKSVLQFETLNFEQIPETRSGKDKIDAVVVDEESGSANQHGFGAKILCGEGAFDLFLAKHGDKESMVHIVIIYFSQYTAHILWVNETESMIHLICCK